MPHDVPSFSSNFNNKTINMSDWTKIYQGYRFVINILFSEQWTTFLAQIYLWTNYSIIDRIRRKAIYSSGTGNRNISLIANRDQS